MFRSPMSYSIAGCLDAENASQQHQTDSECLKQSDAQQRLKCAWCRATRQAIL